ncbi:hypothetical protein BD324DRAFT_655932 [Kockovaella imperatae]|uniref:Uncharacterized protein n=1 Tax=Kockovaella imperatae TaxID=4999 RepID=A0A1Y1UMN1_9TREE|nr:hypothetical protein BD324DRAFT_655932 [Kockovaella imperatae]ORX38744.1 hypothetical protein BD324DRAFT_655932 [Kockovaella imperatae]
MLFLLISLVGLKSINAANCCGNIGAYDANTLWNLRADMCNNVLSHDSNSDGGREDATFWQNGNLRIEYAFEAYDTTNQFANCWSATQDLIQQCALNGNGAGSWVDGSESYYFSASAGNYGKRDATNSTTDPESLPPLPQASGSIDELQLQSGSYNINGMVANLQIQGVVLNGSSATLLSKRDDVYNSTQGPGVNLTQTYSQSVNLTAFIIQSVQAAIQQQAATQTSGQNGTQGSRKRAQECSVSADDYVLVDGGYWQKPWTLASGCLYCGAGNSCNQKTATALTYGWSFSVGLSGSAQGEVAQAAIDVGFSFSRSVTTSTAIQCDWTEGTCHTYWIQQPMTWTRGFHINTQYEGGSQYAVTLQLVHGDAPNDDGLSVGCGSGCCADGASAVCGNPSFCQWARQDNDVEWYGVCNNWDQRPPCQ